MTGDRFLSRALVPPLVLIGLGLPFITEAPFPSGRFVVVCLLSTLSLSLAMMLINPVRFWLAGRLAFVIVFTLFAGYLFLVGQD